MKKETVLDDGIRVEVREEHDCHGTLPHILGHILDLGFAPEALKEEHLPRGYRLVPIPVKRWTRNVRVVPNRIIAEGRGSILVVTHLHLQDARRSYHLRKCSICGQLVAERQCLGAAIEEAESGLVKSTKPIPRPTRVSFPHDVWNACACYLWRFMLCHRCGKKLLHNPLFLISKGEAPQCENCGAHFRVRGGAK